MQAIATSIANSKMMLEGNRVQMIQMLASLNHVSALQALKQAKVGIEKNLDNDELSDGQAEVEENLLMHVEKAIHKALSN